MQNTGKPPGKGMSTKLGQGCIGNIVLSVSRVKGVGLFEVLL